MLVPAAELAGFPLCAGGSAELVPGRNYFRGLSPFRWQRRGEDVGQSKTAWSHALAEETLPTEILSAHCRDGLVGPAGWPTAFAAVVALDGTLSLWRRAVCGTAYRDAHAGAELAESAKPPTETATDCPMPAQLVYRGTGGQGSMGGVGTALAVADLDRDGYAEVAVTAALPPGDGDRVTVLSWRPSGLVTLFERRFLGGVTALVAGDFDGDGGEDLVAIVRLWGSNRSDVWRLSARE